MKVYKCVDNKATTERGNMQTALVLFECMNTYSLKKKTATAKC